VGLVIFLKEIISYIDVLLLLVPAKIIKMLKLAVTEKCHYSSINLFLTA